MLDKALEMVNIICNNGFESYVVGGFVRDYLLDIKSNDIDITTNATPMEIRDIFDDECLPGDDYGSVVVIHNGIRFEITTYRKDIDYIDNRRPDKVIYIDSLEEDLKRRDFTINTICMDKNGEIVDLLNGREDLDNRIIRCVGDAEKKFKEDSLRILRAVRFATILDFKLDNDVIDSIYKNKNLIKNLSYNRKKDELDKIFTSQFARKGIDLLLDYNLDEELEIFNLKNVNVTSSSISIWSVLDVSDKYPFNNNEKDLLNNIKTVMELNNLDPWNLYYYGLYVNSIAGEIKGLDITKITQTYSFLPITSRRDIKIEANDILQILNREPGSFLKDIYETLEREILYNRLNNEYEDIKDFIIKNYKEKGNNYEKKSIK